MGCYESKVIVPNGPCPKGLDCAAKGCWAGGTDSPRCSTSRTTHVTYVILQPLSTVPWTASEGDSASCAPTEDLDAADVTSVDSSPSPRLPDTPIPQRCPARRMPPVVASPSIPHLSL